MMRQSPRKLDVLYAQTKIRERTELALKRIAARSKNIRKRTQDRIDLEKHRARVLMDARIQVAVRKYINTERRDTQTSDRITIYLCQNWHACIMKKGEYLYFFNFCL